MIELLLNIQKALQEGLPYIRKSDIYITPHIGFIPMGVKRPCIGIKDGKVSHSDGAGYSKDLKLPVKLAIFSDLKKAEEAVVGNSQTGSKGVLAIQKDCLKILERNKLGIKGMQRISVSDDLESEMFLVKNGPEMQRKQLGLLYEKQVVQPPQ